MVKHPSHCADSASKDADKIDDFETRNVGKGDIVLLCAGVSGLSEH